MDNENAVSVREVVARYLEHARAYYAGSRESGNLKSTLSRLVEQFGDMPADEMRALRLKAYRERMVEGGVSRGYANRACRNVRRCWKWAAENEIIRPDSLESMRSVAPLKRGRTPAREPEPVRPVELDDVFATLEHLTPTVAGIVELLRLTGARTGEIRIMTIRQLGTDGATWYYRPTHHKTAHHGLERIIPLDEPCQAVIRRHWKPLSLDCPVFESPRGGFYAERSICAAVRRAARRAGVPHWHPHQLRHRYLTDVRAMSADPDAWRAAAGHASLEMTEQYARADAMKAALVQRELRRAQGQPMPAPGPTGGRVAP